MSNVRVAVIIPVFNMPELLTQCLTALRWQESMDGEYAVVVVDNGSTRSMKGVRDAFPEVIWLQESAPGAYLARNRGLAAVVTEIVAFTDADCIPSPGWLRAGVSALSRQGPTIVGGKIEFVDQPGRALNIFEAYEEATTSLTSHQRIIEREGYAVTANLFAFRSAFERAGFFEAKFKSGGDREWVLRCRTAGETLGYADGARVAHVRRNTFSEICRKRRRIIGGRVTAGRHQNITRRFALRLLWRQSLLDPRTYTWALVTSMCHPRLGNIAARAKFAGLCLLMSFLSTVERLRVLAGAPPCRG
jgi:glycosyltransferase involved in cell wall biosynthesis